MVPMHMRQDDVVDFDGCQAAGGERSNDVRVRAHWLAGQYVFADWSGVGVGFAAETEIEVETGRFGDLGM